MNSFNYTHAANEQEAVALATSEHDAHFVAGGTNILDIWKYNIQQIDELIDINSVQHHAIERLPDGGLRLGALATNADTAYNPLIEERYPLLSKAILAGASPQIRNMATNGGNLLQRTRCYYFYDVTMPCNKRQPGTGCSAKEGFNRMMAILGTSDQCIAVFPSDMCVALSALQATVNVIGTNGERSIPFDEFHRLPGNTPDIDNALEPGDLITSIDLPPQGFAKNYSYLKVRDRNSYAFAVVSVATGLELDGNIITQARISLGGVAHKPWRNVEAEEFLIGKTADRENFAAAAELILEGAKAYQYNSFKIELARRSIVRNCLMALDPANTQLPGARPSDY